MSSSRRPTPVDGGTYEPILFGPLEIFDAWLAMLQWVTEGAVRAEVCHALEVGTTSQKSGRSPTGTVRFATQSRSRVMRSPRTSWPQDCKRAALHGAAGDAEEALVVKTPSRQPGPRSLHRAPARRPQRGNPPEQPRDALAGTELVPHYTGNPPHGDPSHPRPQESIRKQVRQQTLHAPSAVGVIGQALRIGSVLGDERGHTVVEGCSLLGRD